MDLGDSIVMIGLLVELNVGLDQMDLIGRCGFQQFLTVSSVVLRKPAQLSIIRHTRPNITITITPLPIRPQTTPPQTIPRLLPLQLIIPFQLRHRLIVPTPHNIIPSLKLIIE